VLGFLACRNGANSRNALRVSSDVRSAPSTAQAPVATGPAVMSAASRTVGMAPLSVFFDATTPASRIAQPTDGDYTRDHYRWDFGDARAGSWPATGRSRNEATGFVAGHVYDEPGHYVAHLALTRTDGTVLLYEQTVDVRPFGGTTYYLSSSGSDANDGRSSEATAQGRGPWRTLAKLPTSDGDAVRGPVRFLFKRGERFPTSKPITLQSINPQDAPGRPFVLGAYGTGARPMLAQSNPTEALLVIGHHCHDVTFMDLDLGGAFQPGAPAAGGDPFGVHSYGTRVSDVALLRLDVHNFTYGVLWGDNDGTEQRLFVVDTTFHDNHQTDYGSNSGAEMVFLGNVSSGTVLSHNVYSYSSGKYYIANNRIQRAGWNDRSNGPMPTDGAFYSNRANLRIAIDDRRGTDHIVITDNVASEGAGGIRVERMDASVHGTAYRNVLIERNVTRNTENAFWGTSGITLEATHFGMVRNNVLLFQTSGARGANDASIAVLGSSDIRILNNSAYSAFRGGGDAAHGFLRVSGADSARILAKNNAAFVTGPGGYILRVEGGTPRTALNSDTNLFVDPRYVSVRPEAFDLRLQAGSAGVAAGEPLPDVREDFDGHPRSSGNPTDIGAYQRAPRGGSD
jgi:hypothetical protein